MKKKIIATVLTTAFVLTGCGTEVPDLSKLDNDKAAEYMAGELLKYDKHYEYALDYDRAVLNPTPIPTQAPSKAPAGQGQTKTVSGSAASGGSSTKNGSSSGQGEKETPEALRQVSLSEVYAVDGIKVSEVSSSLKDSYGKGYEYYKASKGKKLLLLYFQIKNTTGKDKSVVLSKKDIQYELQVDGVKAGQLQQTIADGDLQYFTHKIKAGKSRQGILIFEVDKQMKTQNAILSVTNGTSQATVPLS